MSGVEIIQFIQSVHTPSLDRFFGFVTNLHDVNIYVATFPLLYWLYDKRFTRYLLSVFLLGGVWASFGLKEVFGTARPTEADGVRQLFQETGTGFAFPSGHAQGPMAFYGALALHFRKTWITVVGGLLIFLIGFSRLYLGLHWPIDVLGGWAIGLGMLYAFDLTRRIWIGEGINMTNQLILAVALPLATLVVWRSAPWDAALAVSGESYKLTGAYMGFWVGAILEDRYVGFNPRYGKAVFQTLKVLGGLALVLVIKEGLKPLLPDMAIFDILRYGMIGLASSYVVPAICQRFSTTAPPVRQVAKG